MAEQSAVPAPAPIAPATPATSPPAVPSRRHRFKFYRAGGLDQVALETGADLAALEDLDPKLWIALSCPTRGLELDPRTLELLDLDRDGRVRQPEILEAIRFCRARLADLGILLYGADEVALSSFRTDTPEGRAALGAARHVLAQLGKADAQGIRVADVADTTKVFEKTLFNGDGVVPPEAASDLESRQLALDVIATVGGIPDRGGAAGVSAATLKAFLEEAAAFAGWWRQGEETPGVLVLAERTQAAHAAVQALRAKVDDFFVRCALAAMEPRAALALNRSEPEFAALAAKDLALAASDVAGFPLARAEAGRALPLGEGLNPAWAGAMAALRRDAVEPLLGAGKVALPEAEWRDLCARLAPYEAWLAAKQGARVEKLGINRVRAVLGGAGWAGLEAALAKDETFAAEAAAVADVVRLAHYHRDLATLLKNFVSFADFYDPIRPAVFQAGTLFLDARSCELCVRVDDPAAHAVLGALSRVYVAYCECRRPGEKMNVAACFTQGDSDYLMVGRNGVFWDRRGRDWDATIVKIAESPISMRQAFFAPYKKFVRLVEEQVARFAAAKQKSADDRITAGATRVTDGAIAGAPPPPPSPVDVGRMVGIVAALGVGIGALGTVLGGLVSGFVGLEPWWAKVVAVAAMFALVSGPSVLIAWLKLRQRTLGPILDANGWAVNGRVKINLPLGTALTERAVLPPGARRVLEDPYVDEGARRRRRIFWLLVVLVGAALGAARGFGRWPFGPPFWTGW